MTGEEQARPAAAGAILVLAALAEELAPIAALPETGPTTEVQGLVIVRRAAGGSEVLAAACGIGKVRAAHAAALLLAEAGAGGRPARALLVVGVAGGLRASLAPGTLVHCTRAIQADLAARECRELAACARLRARWRVHAPGAEGWFVTADRPVLSPWRRLRLARAFAGPCVADMETAAAAAVAARAGVAWAALRAVSDGAGFLGGREFRKNFPLQAGRAAATVPALLAAWNAEDPLSPGESPPSPE